MDKYVPRRGTPSPSWNARIYAQEATARAFRDVIADYLSLAPNFIVQGVSYEANAVGSVTAYEVAPGVVCLAGELLPFGGGEVSVPDGQQPYLRLLDVPDDVVPLVNLDGQTDYVLRKRSVTLVSLSIAGPDCMPLKSPTKADLDARRFKGRFVPKGGIVPYAGALTDFDTTGLGLANTAVEGFAICNGLNGTVDLRGLVPMGATAVPNVGAGPLYTGVVAASSPGDAVGADEIVLGANNLPAHTHNYADANRIWDAGSGVESGTGYVGSSQDSTRTSQPNTTTNAPISVRQSSLALVFIQSII